MQRILFIFATLCLLTGCGSGVQFSGTVKMEDGTPIQGATVSFLDTKNQYDGQTDANGKYTLVGATPKDGIPPGQYKVTVLKPSGDDGKTVIPEKYGATETSGLSYEVKSGGTFDITIKKSTDK